MECLGRDGGVPGVPGGMGMLLPFRIPCTDAGHEPRAFCLHHLVFHSTGSALGSHRGLSGTPEGLVKTAGFLDFFCRPALLAIFSRQGDKQMMVLYKQLVLSSVEIDRKSVV